MKTTVIKPKRGMRFLDVKEIFYHRDLLYFLVLKEVKILYKQTVLGFSWAIIRPFLSMIVPLRVNSRPLFSMMAPFAVYVSDPVDGATSIVNITSLLVAL